MTGYYRAFCPNFASVVSPLTDLLSPKSDFVWTNICQQAFVNAKALLVNAPILANEKNILNILLVKKGQEPFFCRMMSKVLNMQFASFLKSAILIKETIP